MIENTLSRYTGVVPAKISRLLRLTQSRIYEDKEYRSWIEALDTDVLGETLPHARVAYERHLPEFTEHLKEKYGMVNTPMSAYTLGNWLVGFLRYPDTIINLSKMHDRIPAEAFSDMLPEIITMLDEMPQGRAEWQRALALMALPLVASRN